ncbi:MAG TPA: hypothetical protein VFB21_08040 [Chthonomonadaceae bacterium]|nr:hypothetical protein [Chthonomonadaceae bacterium]
MKPLLISLLLLLAVSAAHSQNTETLYAQLPGDPPGGTRWSQFWYDPSQQNDLDSDMAAYDNFTLTGAAQITQIEWWGEDPPATPSLPFMGFDIEFYPQDSHTVAMQPDLTQFYGHSPLACERHTDYTQTFVGNGMYHFSVNLAHPLSLNANTPANPRYFLAVIARPEMAYYTWGWAQGSGGDGGGTFYFERAGSPAGSPYYMLLPDDRAFRLNGISLVPVSLKLAATALHAGQTTKAMVTLNFKVPTGGIVVGLASSDPQAVSVPDSLLLAAGATSGQFTVTAKPVRLPTMVTLLATYNGQSQTATVTVLPNVPHSLRRIGGGLVTPRPHR